MGMRRWQVSANDLAILRLKIQKAGGTLIKSRSLLNQLGAPALTLSTGLVVSYRFTDKNQNTSGGGVVICRSGAKKLHSITGPRAPQPEADTSRCQLLARQLAGA